MCFPQSSLDLKYIKVISQITNLHLKSAPNTRLNFSFKILTKLQSQSLDQISPSNSNIQKCHETCKGEVISFHDAMISKKKAESSLDTVGFRTLGADSRFLNPSDKKSDKFPKREAFLGASLNSALKSLDS